MRRDIQVRPFPRPLGRDGRLPLLSTCADIVHSTAAHAGSTIRDNYFVNSGAQLRGSCCSFSHWGCKPLPVPASGHLCASKRIHKCKHPFIWEQWCMRAGDDAIAMHGFYYLVASADPGQQAVILATNRAFTFSAGDSLTFYSGNTSRLGTAAIARMLSVNNPLPPGSESQQIQGLEFDDADFLQARAYAWNSLPCLAVPAERLACLLVLHVFCQKALCNSMSASSL